MAAGDYEEKSLACRDCQRCGGNPPKVENETSGDEIDENFIRRIEFLYHEQIAGKDVSPATTSVDEWTALVAWHAEEKQFERKYKFNLDLLIQSLRKANNERS